MKTTKEVIDELRAQGHEVKTYVRTKIVILPNGEGKRVPDAVRIVGIDGMSFPKSGAEGNKAAREMTGQGLSKRMVTQRRQARFSISKSKLTTAQKARIAKINRELKKAGKKPIPQVTLRRRKKKEGYQSLKKAMINTLQHAQHKAYAANVDFWVAAWEKEDVMPKTRAWLKRHRFTTLDEALYSIVGSQGSISSILVSGRPRDGMSWKQADDAALERLQQSDKLRKAGKTFEDFEEDEYEA